MVTGATGFVGLHTVLGLHEAGHEVRLLVRNPAKLRKVFAPFELGDLPFVEGDITDPHAVAAALEGCNAVVHSAAMVSVRASDSDRVLRNNLRGTQLVLGGAVDRGVERMVQVSSTTALFRPGAKRIDERSPLGTALSGYGRSKIECDRFVRGLQEEGAPIYSTYPGSVIGPDDPGLSEAMSGMKGLLDSRCVFETTSGMQLIDVRDVALAHVRLLERGGPADRFVLGGQYFSWPAFGDLLEEVTGRPFLRVWTPRLALRLVGEIGDLVNLFVHLETPLSREAMIYATEWAESDDSHVKRALGLEYRDIRETVGAAIHSLQAAGHLQRPYALPR